MRQKVAQRCARCWLRPELCYCEFILPIPTETKLSIVMHAAERYKTSSTARLLELLLPSTTVHLVGLKDAPFSGLQGDYSDYQGLLLFPDQSAQELTREYCSGLSKKIHLIVPDGTWSQARKIARKSERLGEVQSIKIPPAVSEYRLRKNVHAGTVCTAEAVAYALGIIEGDQVENKILELFRKMTQALLQSRRSWCAAK